MFRKTIKLLTLAVMFFVGSQSFAQITEGSHVKGELLLSTCDSKILHKDLIDADWGYTDYDAGTMGWKYGEESMVFYIYNTNLEIIKSIDFSFLLNSITNPEKLA